MDAPDNPTFWRSRADLIRECVAAGMSPRDIRARCVAEGYNEPKPEAIYRAKTYKTRGYPVASRPSYYFLWKQFLSFYDAAVRSGKPIVLTEKMHEIIQLADQSLLQDQAREPLTNRRRKRKAKR